MKAGEYGILFRFWTGTNADRTGYDMSGYTELELLFTKPDGTTLTRNTGTSPAVSIGATQVTDSTLGVLGANTYVEYTFANGEVTSDDAGTWTACLTYTDGSKQLIADAATFVVSNPC